MKTKILNIDDLRKIFPIKDNPFRLLTSQIYDPAKKPFDEDRSLLIDN